MAVRHEAVLAKETRKEICTTETQECGKRVNLHRPDGFRGEETNGTAAIMLQPLFLQRPRLKLKKQPSLISYRELCECYCA